MEKNINTLLRKKIIMPKLESYFDKTNCRLSLMIDNHLDHYSIRWQNFKGFTDTKERVIKPITVIIGPNNSGKSSFIAPFLLMNQTITNNEGMSPLILSDKVYDGGNVKELVNNFDLTKEFTFSLRYHIHETDNFSRLKKVGYYPPGQVDITFMINNPTDRELIVKSETIYDYFGREMVKLERNRFGKYQLKGPYQGKIKPTEKEAIKISEPLNFLFSPNSLLYSLERIENPKGESFKRGKESAAFIDLVRHVTRNFNEVRNRLASISYLGPIREAPHRYYQLKNIKYHTVGARGENAPDIINTRKDIHNDLNSWIKRFEFGDTVEFRKFAGSNSMGSIIFKNKGQKVYTNIANAGFGASQILPLIVQALVSRRGTITIAEQPEIHLNPRLQGVLAELFCFMAKKDQTVIVETHSEHLLLRLRTLIAKKEIDADMIAVYFVEKENGISNIREIPIEQNGSIKATEWPKNFFDDTLRQTFELAQAQAKNRNKK